ncbi:LysR family transcriptional regulator [Pseudomaricurvus alkylphenolicus]|uniref:LysR family transcriptional regulator n=1 Tax=Pseudomaricurvus alkylphenolicus TaxID=1306991 RepID=UPI001423CA4E|nr:LysR family transcriptional regulator [Pseudomaricurvus alkylphenolicus]NIB43271.1 LysR family transcriptional regulator [Pseudomaricurvus alkylphenolicus]
MDLRKLQIFCRVAELGSVSRAAESLHMAQPAVSIAVKKLEEELDTVLLQRSKRQVTPTREGLELLQRASAILQQVEALQSDLQARKQLLQGEITIACPSMVATYFLPQLLGDFLTQHSGLTASITQTGTRRIEELLLNQELELGVVTRREGEPLDSHPDLELIALVADEIQVCVGTEHPYRERQQIDVSELNDVPMVLYEKDYFIRQSFDQLCRQAEIQPDIRMQTNFLPLIVRMVRQHLGITVGLSMMAREETDIQGIPLQPARHIQLAVARRRDQVISRANQAFMDWLVERQA